MALQKDVIRHENPISLSTIATTTAIKRNKHHGVDVWTRLAHSQIQHLRLKVYQIFQVPHTYEFTCDNKRTSYNFIKANFSVEHHFCDLREISSSGEGRCAHHEFHPVGTRCPCVFPLPGISAAFGLDILVAGVSCKPYTRARAKRMEGTRAHGDADLSDHWISLVKRLVPMACIFENVWGITQCESKTEKRTPLSRLRNEIQAQLPDYNIVIFAMCGSTWMVMSRRRVYMILVHKRAGPDVVQRIKAMVKDHPFSYTDI